MAELEVKNKQSQAKEGERSQSAGQMARRRESENFPSLFDMSGGELFNMWPSNASPAHIGRNGSHDGARLSGPQFRVWKGSSVVARY